ncbi:unnamed protein product, partial [Hapterophycus canaliculatus]
PSADGGGDDDDDPFSVTDARRGWDRKARVRLEGGRNTSRPEPSFEEAGILLTLARNRILIGDAMQAEHKSTMVGRGILSGSFSIGSPRLCSHPQPPTNLGVRLAAVCRLLSAVCCLRGDERSCGVRRSCSWSRSRATGLVRTIPSVRLFLILFAIGICKFTTCTRFA